MKYIPYIVSGVLVGIGVHIYAIAHHRDMMRLSDRNWGDAVRYKPENDNAREA